MDNRKEDAGNGDRSYYVGGRHKGRKNILTIGILIVGAVIVLGLVFSIQVSAQGTMGAMAMHIHPHIAVSVNDKPTFIPENVGIDNALWKDHSLDKYGMPGMSPLHTHDATGTVHVESSEKRDYTLSEFLSIWGIGLNGKTVKVTVNDRPISDWKNHVLKDKEKIDFEIG